MGSLTELWKYIEGNQFLSGGLIVTLTAAVIAYLRNLPYKCWDLFLRNFTIKLTVNSQDGDAFDWIRLWLSTHDYNEKCTNLLCLRRWVENKPKSFLVPCYGRHYLWFDRRLMIVDYVLSDGDKQNWKMMEKLELRLFSTDRNRIQKLIDVSKNFFENMEESTKVYHLDYDRFELLTTKKIRPTKPILPDNKFDEILADIKRFYESEDWYLNRGINYKRGILLYGAPGNGKGSTILGIAQNLRKNIAFVNLATVSDDKLVKSIGNLPDNCVIVFEEIDCVGATRERAEIDEDERGRPREPLSLGCLLNLLDGLITQHGMVVFATTNHIEKLDKALIRPGRMDLRIEFKNATKSQAKELLKRFHPEVNEEGVKRFLEKVPDQMYSMATLEGHLVTNPTLEAALTNPIECTKS